MTDPITPDALVERLSERNGPVRSLEDAKILLHRAADRIEALTHERDELANELAKWDGELMAAHHEAEKWKAERDEAVALLREMTDVADGWVDDELSGTRWYAEAKAQTGIARAFLSRQEAEG